MPALGNLLVLEWSASQQAFNVQSFIEAMKNNLSGFHSGLSNDYVIVGIFPDRTTCDKFYENLSKQLSDTWGISNLTIDELLSELGQ